MLSATTVEAVTQPAQAGPCATVQSMGASAYRNAWAEASGEPTTPPAPPAAIPAATRDTAVRALVRRRRGVGRVEAM